MHAVHWLPFQMHLSGSANLRAAARVLLDPLDHDDFDDLLAGKEVESKALKRKYCGFSTSF